MLLMTRNSFTPTFRKVILLLGLTLGAEAQAQAELIPVFTLALPDRLLTAGCRGTGSDGQALLTDVQASGATRSMPYTSQRCPQGFSDGWALPAGDSVVFHHYYNSSFGDVPPFSGLWRWQNGAVTQLASLTNSQGNPARSFPVKAVEGALLYSVGGPMLLEGQDLVQRLNLADGSSQPLTGRAVDGSRCNLTVPRLDNPFVAVQGGASAPTLLESTCAGAQFRQPLRFVVDGTSQATARPDLAGCSAFAVADNSLWGLCDSALVDNQQFVLLVRVTATGTEEIARYDRRSYLRPLAHQMRTIGGALVYLLQTATPEAAPNSTTPTGLELYRLSSGGAPQRVLQTDRYRIVIGRGSSTERLWSLAVRTQPDGNGQFEDATLLFSSDGLGAGIISADGFASTVNASTLGADLPGTTLTFFSATTPASAVGGQPRGVEPWVLDRSDFSTRLLADLARDAGPGANSNGNSRPKQFTAFNNAMYFWAESTRDSAAGLASLVSSGGQNNDPVVVFPSAGQPVSTPGGEVRVRSDGGQVTAASQAATPANAPAALEYPKGWQQVSVGGLELGGSSTLSIEPSAGSGAKAGESYALCRRDGSCEPRAGNPTVTDGEAFDLDGSRNGELRVLIARAIPKTSSNGSNSASPVTDNTAHSGGALPPPVLLLLLAAWRLRRRHGSVFHDRSA